MSCDNATILIVDDEPSILGLAEATLNDAGYNVLTASCGPDALALCKEKGGEIGAAVIDVVMPEMSGPELAQKILAELPIPCIFTSGYGQAAGVALKQRDPNAYYIKKPFSPSELVETIAEALGK